MAHNSEIKHYKGGPINADLPTDADIAEHEARTKTKLTDEELDRMDIESDK